MDILKYVPPESRHPLLVLGILAHAFIFLACAPVLPVQGVESPTPLNAVPTVIFLPPELMPTAAPAEKGAKVTINADELIRKTCERSGTTEESLRIPVLAGYEIQFSGVIISNNGHGGLLETKPDNVSTHVDEEGITHVSTTEPNQDPIYRQTPTDELPIEQRGQPFVDVQKNCTLGANLDFKRKGLQAQRILRSHAVKEKRTKADQKRFELRNLPLAI